MFENIFFFSYTEDGKSEKNVLGQNKNSSIPLPHTDWLGHLLIAPLRLPSLTWPWQWTSDQVRIDLALNVHFPEASSCPPEYTWTLDQYTACCKYFWTGNPEDPDLDIYNSLDDCPGGEGVTCPTLPFAKCKTNAITSEYIIWLVVNKKWAFTKMFLKNVLLNPLDIDTSSVAQYSWKICSEPLWVIKLL